MNSDLQSPFSTYGEFAHLLYATGSITDPWLDGNERFRTSPMLLSGNEYSSFCTAAESIGTLYEELCRLTLEHPEWLDDFYHLTPYEKYLWHSSEGRWHGIARVDVFRLADGSLKIAEMNSDTPSGEAEAVVLNHLLHHCSPGTIDPNNGFAEKFYSMLIASHRAIKNGPACPAIGILYPTEMPEDLSMIALYRAWLEERGCKVVLGSPFNLQQSANGRVKLFDIELDILIRHYKTDWWAERTPVWRDEPPLPDADPLSKQLRMLFEAELAGHLTVVNPFGAVLTQNKLTLAFFWQHMELFSLQSQQTIRSLIPESIRLTDSPIGTLPKDDWVLKSDYGCEGDEVIIGKDVPETIWEESCMSALPDRWIVQRRFEAAQTADEYIPNFGVFLIAGRAAGIYTRLSKSATDHTAIALPTYIQQENR
ncbi:MAG: glutathionylspermidine synthase family protein [bacterium]